MRPAIAAVAHEQALLLDHDRRTGLAHLDRKIILQLGRADIVPHQFTQTFTPLALGHGFVPLYSLSIKPSWANRSTMELSKSFAIGAPLEPTISNTVSTAAGSTRGTASKYLLTNS